MQNIFLSAHRGFAYLELLCVLLFIVALLIAMFSHSGKITKFLKKSTLFVMIFFHIQFVIGILMLLWTSPFLSIIKANGIGDIMGNDVLRYTYIEHPMSMLIAAILFTIVNSKFKKNPSLRAGHVIIAIIGLLLFAYALPLQRLIGG